MFYDTRTVFDSALKANKLLEHYFLYIIIKVE